MESQVGKCGERRKIVRVKPDKLIIFIIEVCAKTEKFFTERDEKTFDFFFTFWAPLHTEFENISTVVIN